MADLLKIRAFWKELSQQAIGILIGATLPTMIRIGKVTTHRQGLFELLKTSKFLALIKRHRLEFLSRHFSKGMPCCQVHTLGGFVFHFPYDGISAFAFHIAGYMATFGLTQDRIRLPIADAFALINNIGTLVNRTPIWNLATPFLAAVTFTPFAMTLA